MLHTIGNYVIRQIEFREDGFPWHINKHDEFLCANKGMIKVHIKILGQEVTRRYTDGEWLVIPAGVEHVVQPINDSVKSFLLIEHEEDIG